MRLWLAAMAWVGCCGAASAQLSPMEEHVRAFCRPGPGPIEGVSVLVATDSLGIVRDASPAPGQLSGSDFFERARRAVLTLPCAQMLGIGRTARYQVRIYPSQ